MKNISVFRMVSLLSPFTMLPLTSLPSLVDGAPEHLTGDMSTQKESKQQDLLLIGAGLGRTGTSSFLAATKRIGLKSYHMWAVMGTPGHLDLWLEHFEALKGENPKGISDKVMARISSDGFNATSSMPACFLYKDLMERYPSAKVVLTVRGDGDGRAWAKSVKSSIGLMGHIMLRVPWRWIPAVEKNRKFLFPWIFAQIGAAVDESTGELDSEELARGYNDWVEHVQATVPPERLLVFPAQDGWKPLCDSFRPSVMRSKRSATKFWRLENLFLGSMTEPAYASKFVSVR